MTELVRQAVREFRAKEQRAARPSMQEILRRTSGIWRGGDGLEYQRRLRDGVVCAERNEEDLTLVTRNTKDFKDGAPVRVATPYLID